MNLDSKSDENLSSLRIVAIGGMTSLIVAVIALIQSRWLGPNDRGTYVFLVAVTGLLGLISSFGYGIDFILRKSIKVNARALNIVTANSVVLCSFTFLIFGVLRIEGISKVIFILCVANTIATAHIFIHSDVSLKLGTNLQFRLLVLTFSSIELVASYVLYTIGKLDLLNVLLTYSVLNLFLAILLFLLSRKFIERQEECDYKETIKGLVLLVPFLFNFQFIYFYRFPASFSLDRSELAQFAISTSLAFLSMPVIGLGIQALRFESAQSNPNLGKIKKVLGLHLLVILAVSVFVFVFAEFMIEKFLGPEYLECIFQTRVLAFCVPLFALSVFSIAIRQGQGDVHVTRFSILGLILTTFVIVCSSQINLKESTLFGVFFTMICFGLIGGKYLYSFVVKQTGRSDQGVDV
jgi:O-antigen/teichoic acid export membrane protein